MSDDDEPTPPPPLLTLRDGLPPVVQTEPALADVGAAIAAGTGPVAIDAERASGYRYSSRAYLIQLRREGAGTFLVDPIAFESLEPLERALDGAEWILHAATQDLPCLTAVGLHPSGLFDTELAGRLLGYPKVGLATLVEELLGSRLAKEHSAVDWSTRPLPAPWLEYAALDVEVLVELRGLLGESSRRAARRSGRARSSTTCAASSPRRARRRGGAPPGCTGCAADERSPPYASCGRPATRSPRSATSPRAGSSPTPPS